MLGVHLTLLTAQGPAGHQSGGAEQVLVHQLLHTIPYQQIYSDNYYSSPFISLSKLLCYNTQVVLFFPVLLPIALGMGQCTEHCVQLTRLLGSTTTVILVPDVSLQGLR